MNNLRIRVETPDPLDVSKKENWLDEVVGIAIHDFFWGLCVETSDPLDVSKEETWLDEVMGIAIYDFFWGLHES